MGRMPKVHESYRNDGHYLFRLEQSLHLDDRIPIDEKRELCQQIRDIAGQLLVILDSRAKASNE